MKAYKFGRLVWNANAGEKRKAASLGIKGSWKADRYFWRLYIVRKNVRW